MEACRMIFVRLAVQIIILTDCVPAIRAGIDSYFSAELAHRLTSGPRCASLLVVLTLALLSGAESLLSLQCSWTANPRSPALASHETPPSYWIIPLQFILTQRNIEGLHDVCHPKSASYGKHWRSDDIVRAFTPRDETVDIVLCWLIASSIREEMIALGRSKG
jgi:hypothetical protein